MLDPELIVQILNEWDQMPGSEIPPKPDVKLLSSLLEFTFRLSLKTEERTFVRAKLTAVSKRDLQDKGYAYAPEDYFLEFQKPFPLTIEKATKLSAAFDVSTTSLAVELDTSGELIAWGIIYNSEFPRGRLSSITSWYPPPRALTLMTESPGSLILSFGDRRIGRFAGDYFELSLPDVFTSASLGNHFIEVINEHPVPEQLRPQYWHLYRDCLQYLLSEMARRGHGGTLIWGPTEEIKAACSLVDQRNSLGKVADICDDIIELVRPMSHPDTGSSELTLRQKRRVASRLELIAQLMAADGAVLVTDGFVPLCFGSVLNAQPWTGAVSTGTMAHRNRMTSVDLTKFGTRHNSAANFAGQVNKAVAFVVSEDGPVRAFRKINDRTMFFWNDCLSSVFV